MDEMKWGWVLIVAATLALLVRIATWFLPSPAVRHTDHLARAEDSAPAAAEAPPAAEPAAPAAAPERTQEPPPEEDARVAEALRRFQEPPAPAAPPPPPPEVFHLRRVRWGMAIDDVRAAEDGEPLRAGDRALTYATTTLDLPCLLTYGFTDGRLVRARMAFSDPSGRDVPPLSMAQAQRRFLFLREQLRERYGTPVERTTQASRDVSALRRRAQTHDELAQQYDVEIAEAQERLGTQRALYAKRFERWSNPAERVERAIAPYERDLAELKEWKAEMLASAAQARRDIRKIEDADAIRPRVATKTARWSLAREMHDVELRLDCRGTVPTLDIRYEGAPAVSKGTGNEL